MSEKKTDRKGLADAVASLKREVVADPPIRLLASHRMAGAANILIRDMMRFAMTPMPHDLAESEANSLVNQMYAAVCQSVADEADGLADAPLVIDLDEEDAA